MLPIILAYKDAQTSEFGKTPTVLPKHTNQFMVLQQTLNEMKISAKDYAKAITRLLKPKTTKTQYIPISLFCSAWAIAKYKVNQNSKARLIINDDFEMLVQEELQLVRYFIACDKDWAEVMEVWQDQLSENYHSMSDVMHKRVTKRTIKILEDLYNIDARTYKEIKEKLR